MLGVKANCLIPDSNFQSPLIDCATEHGLHADPGTAFGTGEALYYRRAVQNSVELPANLSSCADYITGTIMDQPVVVTTSGLSHKLIDTPSEL